MICIMKFKYRLFKRIVAIVLVILMTFENPAVTLATNKDTVLSDNDITITEDNAYNYFEAYDSFGNVSDNTLKTDDIYETEFTGENQILIEEDLSDALIISDNSLAEKTLSDNSISENVIETELSDVIEEESDDIYYEEELDDEYEQSSQSSGELLYELTQYRSENVKVYEKPDHSITAYYYEEAVNYRDDDGTWNTIDNRLHYEEGSKDTSDYDGYTNNAAAFDIRFAETADEDKLFFISEGEKRVSFAFVRQKSEGFIGAEDGGNGEEINDPNVIDQEEIISDGTDEDITMSENTLFGWHRTIKLIDDYSGKHDNSLNDANKDISDEDIINIEGGISSNDDAYTPASEENGVLDEDAATEIIPELPKPQTVLYEDIDKDANLEYQLLSDGVKETVIVDSKDAPAAYTFRMELEGMDACLEDGRILFRDQEGDEVYEIPAPEVTDAAGTYDEEAHYTLNRISDSTYELGIHTTPAWFTSSDRQFPIRIDPTIKRFRPYDSLKELGDFVCIGSDGSKNTEKFKVGREVKKDTKNKRKKVVYRTYMNPILPTIEKGSVVTDAKMRLKAGEASKVFYVIPVPDKWDVDTISAKKQPFKSISFKKCIKKPIDYGKNGNVVIDITKNVKEIEEGRRGRYGWCFVSEDEGTENVREVTPYKGKDKPFLEITYRDHTGSEDYYNSHDMSVGNAGNGSIDDYSGRLSFTHLDATSEGERMPISISHIYDIAYGERKGEEKWHTGAGGKSAYGEHMRLSTDVRLLVPAGETDIKKWPYVYIDSDGTKHYFKKSGVSYYVNGEKKTIDNTSGKYPAAKDEDGLGLFVVPVTDKELKNTYPLKIVNKSGSISMYFDDSGYLKIISDSNLREDRKNLGDEKGKKQGNKIEISYVNEPYESSAELSKLQDITDEINGIYSINASGADMLEKTVSCISKLEIYETQSIVLSARYATALHIQKAKDSLKNIPDGAEKTSYKSVLDTAVKELKLAMKENFSVDIKKPVKVTDAAGISAELNYDENGMLVSMSDPYEGGALINYEYDPEGRLIRINHPNGISAYYKYDEYGHLTEAADETGYRMTYSYGTSKDLANDQVTKYTQYSGKKAGQTALISYEGLNTTSYTFSGRDDKTGTKDDIENIYCFDNKGRALSAYSRLKDTGEVIGGTVRAYTDEEDGAPNNIKEEAILGAQVINLLNDGSFEKDKSKKGEKAWKSFNTCTIKNKCHTVTIDKTNKYMGARSAHIKLSDKDGHGGKAGYRQSITVPETGKYTASVYVRTKNLKDASVKLSLSTSKKTVETADYKDSEEESSLESGEGADEGDDEEDEDSEEPESEDSESQITEDIQLESNDGFKRIEATINVKKGATIDVELSLSGSGGEAWFDCAQLEKGDLSNQYNLLPNSGFEDGAKVNPSLPSVPSGWAYGAQAVKTGDKNTDDEALFPDEDGEEVEENEDGDTACVKMINPKNYGFKAVNGNRVLMITGSPIKKRTLIINPNFGNDNVSYTFSCYVKADCVPVSGKRKCGIYVGGKSASYLEDNASGKYICKTGTADKVAKINTAVDDWQYISLTLPVKNWNGKVIEIRFDYENGNLYLDDCMLTKNEVKTKTYTSSGKLKTERKGERVTKYENDSRDRKKKVTKPGGSTINYKYDKTTNDVTSKKYSFKQPGKDSADTLTVSYEYDKYGNTVKENGKSSAVTQTMVNETEYDADGRFITRDTDNAGNVTNVTFDENTGQLLSIEDASGISEKYTYDDYDNLTSVDRDSTGSEYVYDAKNHDRLKKINIGTGSVNDTLSYTYDVYGNVKSLTRLGKDKKLVSYKYLPKNGKLKQTVYGNGNKVTYEYDNREQLKSKTYSKTDIIRFEYDNRGYTARVTDEKNKLKYRYYYDEQGRVTNASVTDCLEKKSREILSFSSVYDKAGRESVFAYYMDGRAYRTEYGYTSDDKPSAAKLPSGGVYGRTYDGFDRIKSERYEPQKSAATGEKKARGNGAVIVSDYGYLDTDRGEEKGKTVQNKKTTYKYTTDLLNNLVISVGTGKNKKTAVNNNLKYDELNRIADFDGVIYTYDDLGRLIKAEDEKNERSWDYSYDEIGNITSSTFTDKGISKEEGYSYSRQNLTGFDGAKVNGYKGGNPKNYLGNSLAWERGRQLKSVTPKKIHGTYSVDKKAEYSYASDGSRLSKTVGRTKKNKGIKTEYILNGSRILAEKIIDQDNNSEELLNYYYGTDGRLLEIGYCRGDDKERHYSVIRNALGDVVALYTAEGTLVGSYEYDPYGKLLTITPNEAYEDNDNILEKNPFRYRGYYYDNETGWYYLQSRYYDPIVKRFINADTPELLTTDCDNLMQYNLFMYCLGDPVNYADFSGHTAIAIAIGAASIINIGAFTIAAAPYIAVVAGVAVIGIIVYSAYANMPDVSGRQENTVNENRIPQDNDALTHNEGESKAPKTGDPNSEYVQKDSYGNVRSKTEYDENGRPSYRDDFDHTHYDKNSHEYLQPHRHYWRYNEKGQVIEKGVQPIPRLGVR